MQFYIPCLQYTTKELINNFFQGEIVDNKCKKSIILMNIYKKGRFMIMKMIIFHTFIQYL